MTSTANQPMRTCIATRTRHPRSQLLRVVVDPFVPGRILPDPRAVMPGRGAWILPTVEAFQEAVKRRAFGRALRVSAQVDTGPVREYLEGKCAAAERNIKEDRTLMSAR